MAQNYDVIFRDDFTGTDGNLPHRGKWFKFLQRHGVVVLSNLECMIDTNTLKLKLTESGAAAYASMSATTRAEFKVPFKFYMEFKIHLQDIHIGLDTSDIRDGVIANSLIYGKELGQLIVTAGGDFELQTIKDGMANNFNSGATHAVADTWYYIECEITDNDAYWSITVSYYNLGTGLLQWTQTTDFDKSALPYIRIRPHVYVQNGTGEVFVDNFKVWGYKTKKPKVGCTIQTGVDVDVISDDVIDFKITQRDQAYPQASVTAKNKGNKYATIGITGEMEIRAGFQEMLFLLFRGYIEAPNRSYPPSIIEIESSKGYAKRLDFRETDQDTWTAAFSGDIVEDIIDDYFAGTFSYDHVQDGTAMDIDSDDESCGELIKKLADSNEFILYVDFNRDIHFCDPLTEQTDSNLVLDTTRDVIRISNREVDEIINSVTVKGGGAISYQNLQEDAGPGSSQALYWERERTYKDSDLTTLASVTQKATALLAEMKDPVNEIPIELCYMYVIELYDLLTVTCTEVGLTAFKGSVAGVVYSFDGSGLRTSISLASKPFVLSDVIGKHETITTNTNVTNVSGTSWTYGNGVPDNGDGSDGDFYMDTTNNNFYKKIAGVWTLIDSYGGGGGGGLAGYIPLGTITEKGSAATAVGYATIASRTVTNGKDWLVAKITVTCVFDTYVQYFWDGVAVSEERLVNVGMIEHFPYGTYSTMSGDGAKKFEVKAKWYTMSGNVYVEINGEEQ